jgi:hypothetical protein
MRNRRQIYTIRKALVSLLLAGSALSGTAQLNFDAKTLHRVYSHPDGFYSYAPSVVDVGDIRYIWTCHNHDPFIVRDNIVISTFQHGQLVDDRSVLAPSFTGWDSFHICDPSVMRSDITYNKVSYHWVMFFLGNDVDRSAHNQIGVALSQSIQGPWEKLPDPVLHNSGGEGWGIGQASALPIDGAGKFLVVYSGNGLQASMVDLSDLGHITVSKPIDVTTSGLEALSNAKWPVGNMDIAYSKDRKHIFAVADIHLPQTGFPTFITSKLAVLSIEAAKLQSGGGKWTVEAVIDPPLTGFPRNHNAGLVRGADGRIANPDVLSAVFTRSCAADSNVPCKDRVEYSYDLWEISAPIKK